MPTQDYDVLIIGSGASGGLAAYTLTQKGVKCLMLDAGPLVDFNRVRGNKAAYELPYHGFGKPGRLPHVMQACVQRGWATEGILPGGVLARAGNGTTSCQPSKLKNTKSFSLRMGPPATPPNWC